MEGGEFARRLFDSAIAYRNAANSLSLNDEFLVAPMYYCAIHAVELALKTHLALAGFTEGRLKSLEFGHKIGALVEAVEANVGFGEPALHTVDIEVMRWAGDSYAQKGFEYPANSTSTIPIDRWLDICDTLIRSARNRLRDAGRL